MKFKILLTALLSVTAVSTAHAQDKPSGHNHADDHHAMPGQTASGQTPRAAVGPHGGTLKRLGAGHVETLVSQAGIQMFVYDQSGQSVSVDRGRGTASLRVEGNAKRYRYELLPDGKGTLTAPVNLAPVAGRQVEIDIQLVGIDGVGNQMLAFREIAAVPASELQLAAAAIARQKICPVTGKPLGSMGDPVVVHVKGQRMFLCCSGCVGAVESDSAKYAAGRPPIAVATTTDADAPAIARQQNCPVMDEPLGSMGTPVKVTIGDKPIYLCCKGCIKKVTANPTKYLAQVDASQAERAPDTASASLGEREGGSVPAGTEQVREGVFEVSPTDAPFIATQKNCPVMDEPLDAMGGPYKVHAAGKAVYICCPGCAKKIAAEPQKWLAVLAQQGVDSPTLR